MKLKVLFFASAREAVGGLTELWLDFPDDKTTTTTRRLRLVLAKRYPNLAETMSTITLAVNEEYVDDDDDNDVILQDGDTVALIPPISGG